MSFIKPIFGDSDVKWGLASLEAQSGPCASLPFSFMASATFSTSSATSWSSFLQIKSFMIYRCIF